MRDEEGAEYEEQIKNARAEGLAELEGRALERAEANKKLKKLTANNAEKLHTVKCSVLKCKVWAYRARQSAFRHLHMQQPDESSVPAQKVTVESGGKRCSIEKQYVLQEGALQGRTKTVGDELAQIVGN